MKDKIQRYLAVFILAAFFLCILINYHVQMYRAQHNMENASQEYFRQVEQIVQANNAELTSIKQGIHDTCLLYASATAYILDCHPTHIHDSTKLQEIANLLNIAEIHIFDKTGTIISGTIPDYFGITMDTGEQISYFLPMLTDTTLSLCQDMTPNTVEQRLMQYAAVWLPDDSYIIQIGLEPTHIMSLTEKNEISYIFSLLTDGEGATLFAIDPDTHDILGSTWETAVGKNINTLGIPSEKIYNWDKGFFAKMGGVQIFCVFHQTDSLILGRVCSIENLYKDVNGDSLILSLFLILIFIAQWIIISKFLDRSFVQAVSEINEALHRISQGNLSERLSVHTTPEFSEICHHVNTMVAKLEGELWQDELTGLYSRRGFYIELENLFKPDMHLENTAIIMIDSDDLKKTNDQYGHEYGDKYLCCIADTLKRLKAPGKIVARLSGDEFAILIPTADNHAQLEQFFSELKALRDVTYLTVSAEIQIPIRFSMGMAIYGPDGNNYHLLLKHADERMYEDKLNRKKGLR